MRSMYPMPTRQRACQLLCWLLLTATISGCGFHLRGQQMWPPTLQPVYLDSTTPYATVVKQLRALLINQGVQLRDDPSQAAVHLQLLTQSFNKQAISINAQTSARQIILTYTLSYKLTDANDRELLPEQRIVMSQSNTESDNQLVSTQSQTEMLKNNLQQRALQALITQIVIQSAQFHAAS